MKRFMLIVLLGSLLTGCGTYNEKANEQPARTVNGGGKGIVANEVEAVLDEESPLIFQYEVKNQTEQTVNFDFTSSQRYDYSVKDKNGKELFLFSSVASFLQALGTETLAPGETLSYEINLSDLELEKGDYELTVWMTPKEGPKYKVSTNFSLK
ncbi:hypothetical protein A8F94_12895 [Bacillus sp. FJAT-27225]|uniref:BsuPI-related putative proteinase inhibitor n=1 Tax=Bacillus sp. FJAT-27225 TaxID=1743144 RepID=UPI00080C26DE|nr:BsuPI-related putative proteinase inhibitor [Bacillus sp. FJAT-27225]OCA85764.1 hypothetical protein A8F94_12895 [Bacillus sp. FJAT-27225]